MAWPVFPVCFFGGGFTGGNQSANTIQGLAQSMLLGAETTSPTAGGTLTINGVSLGSYDYLIRKNSQTISSFTDSDWFTSTEDTRSAWIVVDGGLTINSGQTVIPSVRKLFTVIYVRGNLTVNGSISMTARGANHSGTGNSGGSTTAAAILIANGTYSGVVNPQVPASGGSGGVMSPINGGPGANGSAGTGGGTGGGASGSMANGGASGSVVGVGTGGAGANGTSFSGGGGGGGGNGDNGLPAIANGGAGGSGNGPFGNASGGAGNPAGTSSSATPGQNGTGGVIIVFCTGSISGTGSIVANGSNGGSGGSSAGGSGGGSITVLYGSGTPPTITANGGTGGASGGAGTARSLVLV